MQSLAYAKSSHSRKYQIDDLVCYDLIRPDVAWMNNMNDFVFWFYDFQCQKTNPTQTKSIWFEPNNQIDFVFYFIPR